MPLTRSLSDIVINTDGLAVRLALFALAVAVLAALFYGLLELVLTVVYFFLGGFFRR